MISLEAVAMIGLAAAAVYVAYAKLQCTGEDPRIAWMPDLPEDAAREPAETGRF